MALAKQFRTMLRSGLASGEYEPWHGRLNKLTEKVRTLDHFLDCLKALCDEFDPARPPPHPKARGRTPAEWKADSLALGLTALEKLLKTGIDIERDNGQVPLIIERFTAEGAVKKLAPGSQMQTYAARFLFVPPIPQDEIRRKAAAKVKANASTVKKARYLIDDLADEYHRKKGKPHENFEQLYQFDPGDEAGRLKFHKMAGACAKARSEALERRDFAKSAEKITKAYEEFQAYVRKEMRLPVDMFRLLKWAREPGDKQSVPMKGGATQKVQSASAEAAAGAFQTVTDEIYLDVACIALHEALIIWDSEVVHQGVHRMRMLGANTYWREAWEGDALGFSRDDARYVYGPLLAPFSPKAAILFRARLLASHLKSKSHFQVQNQRRCMEVLAQLKHLKLVDEVTLAGLSAKMKRLIESNPEAVSARSCFVQKYRKEFGYWRIGEGYPKSFSIFWIGPEGDGAEQVYIELDRYPGHVFSNPGNNALGELVEAAQMSDIGESYEALKALACAYLIVFGFALDIITAGIAGTTLRGAVLHFLAERIAEKVIHEGLVAANLDNPVLELVANAIVGARLSGSKKLLSLEELEEAERIAIRGATRPPRPITREAAKEALDAGASKQAKGVADTGSGQVGKGLTQVNDRVFSFDELPNAYSKLSKKQQDKLIKKQLEEFADEEEGLLDRLTDKVNRALEPDDVPAGAQFAAVGAGAGGGGAGSDVADNFLARLIGTAKIGAKPAKGKGAKPPKGSGSGSPSGGKGALPLSANQTKFKKSRLHDRLDEYDSYLSHQSKKALDKARDDIIAELGPPKSISMKDARKRMMHLINLAKEEFGEVQGEMVARSNFDVVRAVHIPIRGESGAPMLDWVGEVRGGAIKFILVEAKGGARTRLGKLSRKIYYFVGGRWLDWRKSASTVKVQQASGEWYYQKICEIYISGQKLAIKNPKAGLARQQLALDIFRAAEKGQVGSIITKFGMDDENIYENGADVIAFFTRKNKKPWDWTNGFPI